jgi:hypothetical protein
MRKSVVVDILLGLVFLVLVAFTYFQNYKYNDNSKDWLNHDYSLGLLKSTSTNTVLMTEGGDNQVFGLAYFQMVEFKRPDVVCYDQKGNVFKRIYGDLRYLPGFNLQLRMDIVDYNIINGKEPFYKSELGTKGEPTFEDYTLKGKITKKNVFMTWTGKELWKYGDYYYKQYGMMYRVSDAKYFIVDKLKEFKSLPVSYLSSRYKSILVPNLSAQKVFEVIRVMEYDRYVSIVSNKVVANPSKVFSYNPPSGKLLFIDLLKDTIYSQASKGGGFDLDFGSLNLIISKVKDRVDQNFGKVFSSVLSELQREGYILVRGDRVYFVKDYDHPNGLDTLDYYKFYKNRWKETPVSLWWDYLTREIAASYNYGLAQYYIDRINEYTSVTNILEPEPRKEITEKIREYINLIPDHIEESAKYGYDMAPILHNGGMLYYQLSRYYSGGGNAEEAKKYLLKAMELMKRAIDTDMFAFYAFVRYSIFAVEYVNSFASPEEEGKYLDEVKLLMDMAIKNMSYRKEYKDITKTREYQDFNSIKNAVDRIKSVPKSDILSLEVQIESTQDSEAKANLYLSLADKYFARFAGIDVNMLNKGKAAFEKFVAFKKVKDAQFYRIVVNFYRMMGDMNNMYKYAVEGLKNTKDNYLYFAVGFAADNLGRQSEALDNYSKFIDTSSNLKNSQEYNFALRRISEIKKYLGR